VTAEVGLRRVGALGAHRCQTLAIARDGHVIGVKPGDELARERGAAAMLTQPKERPRAFAKAIDQPCFGQKLEVAGDARLRLAQDISEVGYGQLRLGEQRQNAQTCRFACSLQGTVEGHEGQRVARRAGQRIHGTRTHLAAPRVAAYIKISLYL
jgi:hypothetical protein